MPPDCRPELVYVARVPLSRHVVKTENAVRSGAASVFFRFYVQLYSRAGT